MLHLLKLFHRRLEKYDKTICLSAHYRTTLLNISANTIKAAFYHLRFVFFAVFYIHSSMYKTCPFPFPYLTRCVSRWRIAKAAVLYYVSKNIFHWFKPANISHSIRPHRKLRLMIWMDNCNIQKFLKRCIREGEGSVGSMVCLTSMSHL